MKMTLKKLNPDFPDAEKVDERIVIYREQCGENPRTFWDHTFKLYSEDRDFCSDDNAENPYTENLDGLRVLKEGYVCFPISVYKHSGYSFSIGDGSNFPDARWDVTRNKIWLYTNKELYENMHGKDTWEKVKKEKLKEIAEQEINELNLDSDGDWYGWSHQRKIKWKKIYENGQEIEGYDWDSIDSCGYYLTDKIESIYPYPEKNIPIYYQDFEY